MVLHRLGWLLLFLGVFTFEQDQYDLIFERTEVIKFNSAYFRFAKTHNFKYNRTNAACVLSADLLVPFGSTELKIEFQGYRKASNEYREFPLRLMFDFCEYAAKNELGLQTLFTCGNSTGCPFRKGLYRSCAWAPDKKKFPANIPGGSYMADLKFFLGSVEILFMQTYGTIKYPECKGC